jgi:hypothetical protein
MNRRQLLQTAAAIAFLPSTASWTLSQAMIPGGARPASRVRPEDPAWPSEESWDQLGRDVGG